MPLSARNQLKGRTEEVRVGSIMAHVTRLSAEEHGLKKDDTVTVVIKSPEVMLQKD